MPRAKPKIPDEIRNMSQEQLAKLPKETLAQLVETAEELAAATLAEKARKNFMAFCVAIQGEWNGETGYQRTAHTAFLCRKFMDIESGRIDRVSLSVPRRHGKLIAHDTPVLTPDGWRRHGELEVGDFVYGLNGQPAKVVWTGRDDWADHEVVFSSGHSVVVHPDHEWTIWERAGGGRERTVETGWLAQRKLLGGNKNPRCTFQMPKIVGVSGAPMELPIHPYVLGVWLGDGRTKHGDICFPDQDVHLYFEVLRCGEGRGWFTTHKDTGVHYGSFHRQSDGRSLHMRLKDLSVGPGSGDKHIPQLYWRASMQQRLELLAGIVDTDGHVEQNGKQAGTRVRIATTSDRLRDDYWSLARSVGYRPTCWTQAPAVSSSGIHGRLPVHYVNFAADERLPTRVPRKKITRAGRVSRDGIVEVRKVEPKPGRCIQVDRADGLYLVGRDLQPTHNSFHFTELGPAWFMGRNAGKEVMICSYSGELAEGFGRTVRNVTKNPMWQRIFPKVKLSADSQAADRFAFTNGSKLYALGREGTATGRGAHLLILDDMFSSQSEADSEAVRRRVVSFYESVARTGVYPGGRIVMIGTRWREDDLIGHVLKNHAHEGWRQIRMPAILDEEAAKEMGREAGEPLWPERYTLKELERVRLSMTPRQWEAMYQQQPTSEGGNILKREWWRRWGVGHPPEVLTPEQKQAFLDGVPPDCVYIFQVWDTAYTKTNQNDPSACITWGVFLDRHDRRNLVMLEARGGRWEFPTLLKEAKDIRNRWKPHGIIVEAKASGHSLIQELALAGIFASAYSPGKGDDKVSRAYAAQPSLEGGTVWAPDRRWAEDVIEQCMPAGTEVVTIHGIRDISEIKPGDYVMTHRGRWRPVTAVQSRMTNELFTIQAKTLDPISLTANHPVYVHHTTNDNLMWIPAKDIKVRRRGKRVRNGKEFWEPLTSGHMRAALPQYNEFSGETHLSLTRYLTKPPSGRTTIIDSGEVCVTKHVKSQTINMRQRLDHDFGWLLGLYLAEGSSTRYGVTWSLSHLETSFAEKAAKILSRFGCRVRIVDGSRKGILSVIANLPLIEKFWKEFGCSAETKNIPDWCWDTPSDFRRGLIDGWVDGDGWEYNGRIVATSVSKSLVWGMRLMLASLGNSSSIGERPAGTCTIEGRHCNTRPSYSLRWRWNGKSCAQQSGDCLTYSIEQSACEKRTVEVFNFSVYEDESYLTTGGVVHNCSVFPGGKHDDWVDCVTLGINRARGMNALGAESDAEREPEPKRARAKEAVY